MPRGDELRSCAGEMQEAAWERPKRPTCELRGVDTIQEASGHSESSRIPLDRGRRVRDRVEERAMEEAGGVVLCKPPGKVRAVIRPKCLSDTQSPSSRLSMEVEERARMC